MSNALVNASGGARFAQQGQVDWVALSQTTLTFSFEILSRLSKAGVETLTVAVGQAIFSGLAVPLEGQRTIAEAISKLKAYPSYEEVLWFGFGYKHLTKTMCETEQGATCVAVCACLTVSYDTLHASQVLKALADLQETPGNLSPSLSQWGALVTVCAGAISASKFPLIVEGFSRLIPGESRSPTERFSQSPAPPSVLADAIFELFKVSNSALMSVTFEGGIDCGWILALADWLLHLRVEVINSAGDCIYANFSKDHDLAQVTGMINTHVDFDQTETMTTKRSFFLAARPGAFAHDFLNKPGVSNQFYNCGTTEWSKILTLTFGDLVTELLRRENSPRLRRFFCSLFYSLSAPISGPLNYWNFWSCATPEAYEQRQRQFLQFSAVQLPELAKIWHETEQGLTENDVSKEAFRSLKNICECRKCSGRQDSTRRTTCLHQVGSVIFQYLVILFWLDLDVSVKPSLKGLFMMFDSSGPDGDRGSIVRNIRHNFQLRQILALFTGFQPDGNRTNPSDTAVTAHGVCVYSLVYDGLSEDSHQLFRYRVIVGQIEHNSIPVQIITDNPVHTPTSDEFLEVLLEKNVASSMKSKFSLEISETLNSRILEAGFIFSIEIAWADKCDSPKEISCGSTRNLPIFARHQRIGPSMFLKTLVRTRCLPPECQQIRIPTDINDVKMSWIGMCTDTAKASWDTQSDCGLTLPRVGDWVLHAHSGVKHYITGDSTLLYSLICFAKKQYDWSLFLVDRCLICSVLTAPALDYEYFFGKFANNILNVQTITGKQTRILRMSVDRGGVVDECLLDKIRGFLSRCHNYQLRAIFEHRMGSPYKRISKKVMIKQIISGYEQELLDKRGEGKSRGENGTLQVSKGTSLLETEKSTSIYDT